MNIIKLLESLYGTMCHGVREAPVFMIGAFFILTNSLNTITYYNNDVLAITDERFTLGYAYADIRNDSCTLYVLFKVPTNTAFNQTTEIAILNEKVHPVYNKFLTCTSWGGRAVANTGVLNSGVVNFAMTTAVESTATTLDMYFETTYRLK